MTPPKYPRTPHLPFSLELHKDDRYHRDPSVFVGTEVVVTEKMDGGNTCIHGGDVYARSTGQRAVHPSFDYVKAHHVWKSQMWPPNRSVYGENLYARHSIAYEGLKDYYFVFGIRDDDLWREWSFVESFSEENGLLTVPVLYRGTFDSVGQIEQWMKDDIARHQNRREGYVIRLADAFPNEDFSTCVAKFVRRGHVQTDEHWSRNWIPNKLAGQDPAEHP